MWSEDSSWSRRVLSFQHVLRCTGKIGCVHNSSQVESQVDKLLAVLSWLTVPGHLQLPEHCLSSLADCMPWLLPTINSCFLQFLLSSTLSEKERMNLCALFIRMWRWNQNLLLFRFGNIHRTKTFKVHFLSELSWAHKQRSSFSFVKEEGVNGAHLIIYLQSVLRWISVLLSDKLREDLC